MINIKTAHSGMRLFAELVVLLGTSTKTNDKLEALTQYFAQAADRDKVWVIALFSGRKPKRTVNATQLQEWCREITGLPQWLFEESYHTVGDLAETIALLLPEPEGDQFPEDGSLSSYLSQLIAAGKEEEAVKKALITGSWRQMNSNERFVFNKLITGGFRIGVSQKMIVNALARTAGVPAAVIAHRISGSWDPSTTEFSKLLSEEGTSRDISQPYPFYLAYALEDEPASLGDPSAWQAEWKWDGIRGEIIKREGSLFVWSRGEELMTEKFPEYQALKDRLPDGTVLDGEIIGLRQIAGGDLDSKKSWGWAREGEEKEKAEEESKGVSGARTEGEEGMRAGEAEGEEELIAGAVESSEESGTREDNEGGTRAGSDAIGSGFSPLPFAALQTRIGRKNLTKKQLEAVPVGFIAYDLLEFAGEDWRNRPLTERREQLEKIVATADHPLLQLSPVIPFHQWEELAAIRELSRDKGSEGVMLKHRDSLYQVGRKRGNWWKWKVAPLVIDAVMVYAQKGHGRRSNLYTDYTFAVKDGDKLVTFTKAYSGLTDKELGEVDAFVKRNSLEKFGPVRTVKPELVFEIAFEGIAASGRHKSGVALRFPRINRWRKDKKPAEINTLEDLQKMLQLYGKEQK